MCEIPEFKGIKWEFKYFKEEGCNSNVWKDKIGIPVFERIR